MKDKGDSFWSTALGIMCAILGFCAIAGFNILMFWICMKVFGWEL